MKASQTGYWLWVCLCLLLTATFDDSLAGESASNVEETVRLCLLQHWTPNKPTFWEQLTAVCRRSDTVKNDIVQALLHILERGMQAEKVAGGSFRNNRAFQDTQVGPRAAITLGYLRSKEAMPLLMRAAKRKDEYGIVAISAVIQIADTNMLDFARQVCTDPGSYGSDTASLSVFFELARHVTSDIDEKIRTSAMNFLIENLPDQIAANDWNSVNLIDEALCKVDDEYSRSHEREAILEKFKDAPFYFPKKWKTLREIPSERRTHVDLKTLAMKQRPPKPAATNSPPDAPKVP